MTAEDYVLVGRLIGTAVVAGIAYWVYKDAKKRGSSRAAGWAAGVFFALIIALPLYFIFRPKKTEIPGSGMPNSRLDVGDSTIGEPILSKPREISLFGKGGIMNGYRFPMQGNIICIGTDASSCAIVYPPETAWVAPLHCQLVKQGTSWSLTDFSDAGTFVNGERIVRGIPRSLNIGDVFWLVSPENSFSIEEMTA